MSTLTKKYILCSGQKCLQFYLTFTSCLPLPLLTFCQIKNIEKKNMCPGGQRYFQDLELLQVVINSLSQLFVRLCHATLWNRDHAISSLKVKVKSFEVFFLKFGLNQSQAGIALTGTQRCKKR